MSFAVAFAIIGVFGTLFYMLYDEYRFIEDIDK
ncbi:hypothetical protein SAMN05216234_11448 [Hydrogenimonas thermophila]|uniref:Uncharacterized protein n=1 Tax=Hydrogenimonas thermophila TaxID=223786 RepID=A0A1I5PC12_9BACT|nr:hypothetical protein SAMN05216234_11448 [Hydrogenimonas thermophila]